MDSSDRKKQALTRIAELRDRVLTVKVASAYAQHGRNRCGAETYMRLFGVCADALVLFDAHGAVQDFNSAATRLFGYTRDEMSAMSVYALFKDEELDRISEQAEAFFSGEPLDMICKMIKADGIVFSAEVKGIFLPSDGMIGQISVSDLTDRYRAEASRETDNLLLFALMDSVPDLVYFKDTEGRLIRVNKAFKERFGFANDADVAGKTDFDLFAKEHAEAAQADEKLIIRNGLSMVAKEEREVWADGRITWASTTKAPFYSRDGRIIGTFGISRDISRQKQFEHEHRLIEMRLQEMQKTESLETLAGGVAHDMNNMLGGILGNADLALTELPANSGVAQTIREIQTATLRAADLVKQLLAYAGKGAVTVESVDLGAIIREMTRLVSVSIHKEITVDISLDPNVPPIDGDPTQIRQVIMNLIINASDAIGKKTGRISVKTGAMDCDAAYLLQTRGGPDLKAGHYVYVEVSDSGCGISAEHRDKLFTPFFTTKKTGRGLGLATIFGIVRGHKGAIRVYSELDKGTTFKVLFRPGEKPMAEIAAKPKKILPWKGSGTILVVDDEDMIRHVTRQMLSALGFTPLDASSGQKALELFNGNRDKICLVLLDEVMPHLGGEEVFAELRKIRPDIPVILCSGYGEKEAMTKQTYKGLAGFLQKPFTLQLLAEKVKSVLTAGEK